MPRRGLERRRTPIVVLNEIDRADARPENFMARS
jgi:predicted membrane GTPase involved in stress response